MGNNIHLTARITGRVQGVGYRYFARKQANALFLSGWVRNNVDGSVTIEAEGQRADLDQYIEELKRGPSMARIDRVSVQWGKSNRTQSGFSIRYF